MKRNVLVGAIFLETSLATSILIDSCSRTFSPTRVSSGRARWILLGSPFLRNRPREGISMTVPKRPLWPRVLGFVAAVILCHIWLVPLAPPRWNLRYPGGPSLALAAMLLATAGSAAAGKAGMRWWFLVALAALATLAYLGWFYSLHFWS